MSSLYHLYFLVSDILMKESYSREIEKECIDLVNSHFKRDGHEIMKIIFEFLKTYPIRFCFSSLKRLICNAELQRYIRKVVFMECSCFVEGCSQECCIVYLAPI